MVREGWGKGEGEGWDVRRTGTRDRVIKGTWEGGRMGGEGGMGEGRGVVREGWGEGEGGRVRGGGWDVRRAGDKGPSDERNLGGGENG